MILFFLNLITCKHNSLNDKFKTEYLNKESVHITGYKKNSHGKLSGCKKTKLLILSILQVEEANQDYQVSNCN